MKKVIITGVNGFIGRHCARHFSSSGFDVWGVDVGPEEQAPIADLRSYRRLKLPSTDLATFVAEVQPFLLIHCAGRASVPLSVSDPKTDFQSGPVLTWDVLDNLRNNSPDTRLIFLSSAAVYGTPFSLPVLESSSIAPISPYGSHKHLSELICKEFFDMFGIRTSSLRVFSAYGPGLQRQVMWDLCHQAMTRHAIAAQGTGAESRDFVHVKDICQAVQVVAEKAPMRGEAYNLGSGKETAIRDLAALIVESLGLDVRVTFDGHVPKGTPLNWRADITRLSELGFRPSVDINRGVAAYAVWAKAALG